MTVHLKKLSVGSASLDDLRDLQQMRLKQRGRLVHVTRNRPRRATELLDGGSIYWIIKGVMIARQQVVDLVDTQRVDGSPACGLLLDPALVPVTPTKMRIFQGWRYLESEDAPEDLGISSGNELPNELVAELRGLGIL